LRKIDNHFDPGSRPMSASAQRQISQIARELKVFLRNTSPKSTATLDEAIAPVVAFAVARLRRTTPTAAKKNLANSAWKTLGRHLAGRLAFALGPTLRLELTAARAVARSLENKNQRRRVGITLQETIHDFPEALATAARLIADWIDAQQELLCRIWHDQKRFRVTAIHPGLSDPHDGGRSVTLVEFADGGRVIYKPRSCAREQIWFGALTWLNRNGFQPFFRVPRLVERQTYSWMESLRTTSCRNSKAVRAFYFRWGAQAALAQILRSSDLHRENWLAVGPQPILVDAELIGTAPAHSRKKPFQDRQSLSALLETGLLPLTARDRAGLYRGIAPFDSALSQSALVTCWPRCQGALQAPQKYVSDLVRGFEAVAEIVTKLERTREFFDEIILPLSRTTNGRLLFRASAEYARILRDSLEPSKMISVGDRWRWLARECCASPPNRRIGLAEARALLRCDLPKFTSGRSATAAASWKTLATAIANLKGSSKILRKRVRWGTHGRS
jgi:lantibiotic modifying enzyme